MVFPVRRGPDGLLRFLGVAGVDGDEDQDQRAVRFVGQAGQRRCDGERGRHAEFARSVRHVVGELVENRRGLLAGKDDHAGTDVRAQRVGAELERGDHTEVAAASAQCPEQVRVLRLVRVHLPAVDGDHLAGGQVVDGGAEAPHEVTDAAAEGQSGDAGGGDGAGRHHQAVFLGGRVQFAEEDAGLGPHGARVRVDGDPAHAGQVEDESAARHGVTVGAVAAATDDDREVARGGVAQGGGDVVLVRAPCDQCGAGVGGPAVADDPGLVEAVVARA
jgi:hypothetical protein